MYRIILMVSFLLILTACSREVINPEVVTYEPQISRLMNNYCITCHAGSAPSAGLLLNAYEGVKKAGETGKLWDRINDTQNPMPPSGPLSEDKRTQIKNWIDGGYKK